MVLVQTVIGKTWWCGIPINLYIESEDLFDNHAFIKINFYEDSSTTISLKFNKKRKWVKNEDEYQKFIKGNNYAVDTMKYYDCETQNYYNINNYYDKRVFKNNDIFTFFEKMLVQLQNDFNKEKIILYKSKNGNTKTQPQMNIFTIPMTGTFEQFEKIKEIIKKLMENLNGKKINIEVDKTDDKLLKVKEIIK